MIPADCKCGHRELDHDGPCDHRSCGCRWYRPKRGAR